MGGCEPGTCVTHLQALCDTPVAHLCDTCEPGTCVTHLQVLLGPLPLLAVAPPPPPLPPRSCRYWWAEALGYNYPERSTAMIQVYRLIIIIIILVIFHDSGTPVY